MIIKVDGSYIFTCTFLNRWFYIAKNDGSPLLFSERNGIVKVWFILGLKIKYKKLKGDLCK
jgi:hypothetical protein